MTLIYSIFPLFNYYLLTVIFVMVSFYLYRNKSSDSKVRYLYVLCVLNFFAYVWNLYYFFIYGSHILTLLPLQLCNIGVFLIPASIALKKNLLMDFAFYLCLPGALAAILIPSNDYAIVYSGMTISYYIFHGLIFLIPLMMAHWKLYDVQPSVKKAIKLTIMVLLLGGTLHLFNVFMYQNFRVPANYFFTIKDWSAPTNPAFALFAQWIPYDFFYLLPALPILYVYMLVLSGIRKIRRAV
jgi:uncharacterized membrane protein YwaF